MAFRRRRSVRVRRSRARRRIRRKGLRPLRIGYRM